MARKSISITAKTSEEFKRIEELLDLLPEECVKYVDSASMGSVGLELHVSLANTMDKNHYLPESVFQISDFGDWLGVYCDKYFVKFTHWDRKKLPTLCIYKSKK